MELSFAYNAREALTGRARCKICSSKRRQRHRSRATTVHKENNKHGASTYGNPPHILEWTPDLRVRESRVGNATQRPLGLTPSGIRRAELARLVPIRQDLKMRCQSGRGSDAAKLQLRIWVSRDQQGFHFSHCVWKDWGIRRSRSK